MKVLEFLDELVIDVNQKIPRATFEALGWKFHLVPPHGKGQEDALMRANRVDGWQFLSVYKKWVLASSIEQMESPSGNIMDLNSTTKIQTDPKSEPIELCEYVVQIFEKLPHTLVDAMYRRLIELKKEFQEAAGLPEDEGLFSASPEPEEDSEGDTKEEQDDALEKEQDDSGIGGELGKE